MKQTEIKIESLKKGFSGSDDYMSGVNDGLYMLQDALDQITWRNVADCLPPLYARVIRSDYAVDGHPEWNNQCIDYLSEDCNTGEIKWYLDKRKPTDENWMPLQEPPKKDK